MSFAPLLICKPTCESAALSVWEIAGRSCLLPNSSIFSNRNNPGANYVTNVASLPVPSDQAHSGNVSDICNQLRLLRDQTYH